jgi:nucleoside-diphosphate-sugar epimerase
MSTTLTYLVFAFVLSALALSVNANDRPELVDQIAERNMLPMQPGDVEATYADVESLANDVGYRPHTSLDDGIAAFVAWYKGFYKLV